jgi:hypothetical protein
MSSGSRWLTHPRGSRDDWPGGNGSYSIREIVQEDTIRESIA